MNSSTLCLLGFCSFLPIATFSLTDLRCAPTVEEKKKMFFFPFSFALFKVQLLLLFPPFGRYCKGRKKKSSSSRIILRVIQSSLRKRGATPPLSTCAKNSSAVNLCSLWSPARNCNVRTDDNLFSPFRSISVIRKFRNSPLFPNRLR